MGNWIPSQELTDVELHDIKKLKENRENRGNEGVLRLLYLSEKNVLKIMKDAKGEKLIQAQGIYQFLDEFSELIQLK